MKKTGMIILNYNNPELIIGKIDLLNSYDCIDKILIVDNNSKDNSYEILKKYENSKIEIVKTDKNGGYAYGNNFGFRYLENQVDYAFIMNPDVIIENEELEKIINNMENNPDYAILGAIRTSRNNVYDQSQFWEIPGFKEEFYSYLYVTRKLASMREVKVLKQEEKIFEVGVVPGCLFLINMKVGKKVDYFDENTFLYYEENILAKKIKEEGYKSGIVLNAKYVHDHDMSASENNAKKDIKKYLYDSKKYYFENYLQIGRVKKIILRFLNKLNRIERGIK